MKATERMERNLRIVLARQREVPVKTIAAQYEISERQVRRIVEDWNKGSLKDETELAADHVRMVLEQTRQDIEALQIASVDFDPMTRIKALRTQVTTACQSLKALRSVGVSFEGVLDGGKKDIKLIQEVNRAVRYTLIEHGVEGEAIEEATEASVQVFGKWGYPVDL